MIRIIYLPLLFFLISSTSFSQPCGWSYSFTASNATIAIQQPIEAVMWCEWNEFTFISDFDCPVWLGAFYYDDNGQEQCGGYVEWNSTENFALAAWGDDPTTPEKDGFSVGDGYIFKLCVDGYELGNWVFDMSIELPFTATYSPNGLGNLTSLSTEFPESCEVESCEIKLSENFINKKLLKTVDIYGRDISAIENSGFVIQIFSDQTVSKTYRF
tara:strand:+ start:89 stop:730 length:642 start_codon:yes stop_codon:yes gene_type:complete